MANCKVKRDVTVTLSMSENEAGAIFTALTAVHGGHKDIKDVLQALRNSGVGHHPDFQSCTGQLKWSEDVPF